MKIRYVFWDSDNTLIDTASLHWAKHRTVLHRHGIDLDPKHRSRVHRNNGSQNWQWMTKELGLPVSERDYLEYIDLFYARNTDKLKLLSNVHEALELFRNAGIKQCVVSNGRRSSVLSAHNHLGLAEYFQFILCKEDYEGRKPDAAPYLAALNRMGQITGAAIHAGECLAIEDDPLGVESAKRAGMATIFRPTVLASAESDFADYTVGDGNEFLEVVSALIELP